MKIYYFEFGILVLLELSFSLVLSCSLLDSRYKRQKNERHNIYIILYIGVWDWVEMREEERKTINQNMKIYFKFGILILCELSFSLVLSLIVKIKYENNDGYIGVWDWEIMREDIFKHI